MARDFESRRCWIMTTTAHQQAHQLTHAGCPTVECKVGSVWISSVPLYCVWVITMASLSQFRCKTCADGSNDKHNYSGTLFKRDICWSAHGGWWWRLTASAKPHSAIIRNTTQMQMQLQPAFGSLCINQYLRVWINPQWIETWGAILSISVLYIVYRLHGKAWHHVKFQDQSSPCVLYWLGILMRFCQSLLGQSELSLKRFSVLNEGVLRCHGALHPKCMH